MRATPTGTSLFLLWVKISNGRPCASLLYRKHFGSPCAGRCGSRIFIRGGGEIVPTSRIRSCISEEKLSYINWGSGEGVGSKGLLPRSAPDRWVVDLGERWGMSGRGVIRPPSKIVIRWWYLFWGQDLNTLWKLSRSIQNNYLFIILAI